MRNERWKMENGFEKFPEQKEDKEKPPRLRV
jgi:hypothetical protein